MLAQTVELLASWKALHPGLWITIVTTAGIAALLTLLASYLRPTGKRRGTSGRKSKLPPGPRGLPIIGSMHKLATARHDPDHTYVSFFIILIAIYGNG